MRKHMQILGVVLGLILLAACGASPTSSTSPTSAPSAPSTASITIKDPWARAAAMTGASASGGMDMGNSGTVSNTAAMSGTMTMGDSDSHTASGGTSAAYMVLENSGGSADALIKAESDVADSVELHTMTMQDNVMKMSPVEKIDIPANGQAELKPGGFHVMLIGLRHDLKEGDMVKITLTFQNSGTMEVEAPVRKP